MIGQLRESSPRRIGPYETLARLGAGGMGEVFLARPLEVSAYGPGDLVAVKAIRNELATDAVFRRRFRREAEVAAAISDPYVARLVGSDTDAEQPWLATEYVVGPTLAEAVRGHGPLPAGAVASLGEGMARALAAVHGAGALHRDLKPANVLLAVDGPKVIDFGVARVQAASTMTSTGLLVGTPGFMSPEHVAGGRHVVAASDVFCLASVLTYAVTGRDPFGDGPVAAVLYRVSQAETDLSGMPGELRSVLAACLVRDPDERPAPADLVERFGALREAATAPEWPEPVHARISEARRDVEQLCAAGRPLLPVPVWPDAAAGAGHPATAQDGPATAPGQGGAGQGAAGSGRGPGGAHQLPTMSGSAPPVPGDGAPAPRSRRRRRAVLGVVAVGVVAAALGGVLAVWGPGTSDAGGSGGGSGSAGRPGGGAGSGWVEPGPKDPAAVRKLIARAEVSGGGTADASGVVPQIATQRPQDWKPWRGRLSHAPMGCSADTRALVCLLTNGTYEAVRTSDGKRLWTSGKVDPESGLDEAYYGPSGSFFMPGDRLEPGVRGGKAAIARDGVLHLRDSTTGKVLWKAEPPDGRRVFSKGALLDDDVVVVGAEVPYVQEDDPAPSLHAYDAATGRPLWEKPLGEAPRAKADLNRYTVRALRDGVVYADQKEGLAAYDAKTGDLLGQSTDTCGVVLATAKAVLCAADDESGGAARTAMLRLAPRTLKRMEGKLPYPSPQGDGPAPFVSAADDAVAVVKDAGRVLVHDVRTGKSLYAERTPKGNVPPSAPLILGKRVVYAGNEALYALPLGDGGGKATRLPVPGAPGDRPEPPPNAAGTVISETLRPPTVLALGGVAHIVYDEGRISSVAIP
ncbi:protein kinase domain-containing protein [Streptomyces flavofungini]|uniref:serine/threonine-protein kinase n=1 Tax=Streptomyces flavofungini TaxID=68200 RepID=UPI0025B0394E|nr:serine/threonine-protein kinase [Streptomyces flavofungini]WJV46065.1 protein kinase [Streptomyces flavofungini]